MQFDAKQLAQLSFRKIKRLVRIVMQTWRGFFDNRCPRVAAALSFTSVLALVPLLTVGISAMSIFPVFEQWSDQFQDLIYNNLSVPSVRDEVAKQLNKFVGNAGKLTTFGLMFLLLASLLALSTIEDAFNDIWKVSRGRSLIQRVLVYWAVLSLGPVLVVVSFSMTSYFSSFADVGALRGFLPSELKVLPFILSYIALLLIYTAVPNYDVPLKPALIGALIAAVASETAKRALVFYLKHFDSYQAIYGALAALPIILLWVYLSWLIVLFGVQIVVVLSKDESDEADAADTDTNSNEVIQ